MKNKGFTLVELLAVIVILGLLLTIAVPNILKVSSNVKEKSYTTKIEMIETAAVSYGEKNFTNELTTVYQKKIVDDDHKWIKVTESDGKKGVEFSNAAISGYYPSIAIDVDTLARSKNLNYDEESRCGDSAVANCSSYYDNVIFDPVNDDIINRCTVYIYFKNNRIYSVFDRVSCDNETNSPSMGSEYIDAL